LVELLFHNLYTMIIVYNLMMNEKKKIHLCLFPYIKKMIKHFVIEKKNHQRL
jgi:hypothetical protein